MCRPQAPHLCSRCSDATINARLMTSIDDTLLDLARSQHGLLTSAQIQRLGVTRLVVSRWSRGGLLTRQLRGVYAVTHLLETATGADAAEQAHLLRCRAALLVYPDGVLAGASAVLAHGLPVWGCDLTCPVVRRPKDRGRGIHGVHIRRPARASVDTAYGAALPVPHALAELATEHGIVPGVVSADAALHRRLTTPEEMRAHVDGLAVRWSSRATAVSKLMDGRSESPGESRLRCILGFEGWTLVPQVEVRDESGHVFARLDGVIEGTRVALEFDGRIKYAEGNSAVLLAEKDRGDRLRALNWIVVRVSWSDLEHPARLFAKIRGALATAASLVA